MKPIHKAIFNRIKSLIPVQNRSFIQSVKIIQENDNTFFDISMAYYDDSFITTYRFLIDDANDILNESAYEEKHNCTYHVVENNSYYEIIKFMKN